jgi:nicotinamidase-related amidase
MRRRLVYDAVAVVLVMIAVAVVLPSLAQAQGVLDEWSSVKAPPPPEAKLVTIESQKTALVVMDFDKRICRPDKRVRCFRAIPKVKKLLDEARAHNMVVAYTRGPNMKPSDFVDELRPIKGEEMFVAHANKFEGNDLNQLFKKRGITTVIITGTSPNGAVIFTVFGASRLGYKVLVPVDTMPGDTAYTEQISAWGILHDPGLRDASTLTSVDKITFK